MLPFRSGRRFKLGCFMRVRLVFLLPAIAALFLSLSANAYAGFPQVPSTPIDPSTVLQGTTMANFSGLAMIYVKGPKGESLERPAVVTVFRLNGQVFDQGTTKAGFVKFDHVPYSEFKVQVIAPGYETGSARFEVNGPGSVTVTVNLQPMEAEEAAAAVGFNALPSKVQKDVGKALEAFRANKPSGALSHLQAAQRNAPNSAEIDYLFGLYSSKTNDPAHAMSYWMKTLELNPRHLSALIEVAQELIHENKPADAQTYLTRAVDAGPDSWRAQALLAEAYVLQSNDDEAMKHAQRAIDLGHERATLAQLVIVRALVQKHETDAAIQRLEAYVKAHPADKENADYLNTLKNPQPGNAAAGELIVGATAADALPVPSNWLPPDVDSAVPAVEPGATCGVDDVVKQAGERLLELVKDVDRFTATESLMHQSIDKYGLPSSPEKRKFDYVVSIQEVKQRYLNVEEYRNMNGLPAQFPEGVATNGLPALVLIFHPYNVGNFEVTCEGLARLNTGLAWQVHFKQRPDKPNTIKRYRIGADGPSYPVSLKGRAWISADTYQIQRLETDLIAPLPQIKLVADHTAIEYGPVKFRSGQVNMWLPQSAEVYYDWKGRRIHRRHSFSNYLLFAVDDKQKISVPKVEDVSDGATGPEQKEKP